MEENLRLSQIRNTSRDIETSRLVELRGIASLSNRNRVRRDRYDLEKNRDLLVTAPK